MSPLDLHVLGTPPAFVLSQDQTLPFNPYRFQQTSICLRVFNSLESSLSLPIIARLLPLYRFQGSLLLPLTQAPFRHPRSSELGYNNKPEPPCQPLFSTFFEKNSGFSRPPDIPLFPSPIVRIPRPYPWLSGDFPFPNRSGCKENPVPLQHGIPASSISATMPPPRQRSPSYSTALCPGVTARWGVSD